MNTTKLLGAVTSILIAIIAWFAVGLNNRVDAISDTQAKRGEKISTLEVDITYIKQSLERIENKLDK